MLLINLTNAQTLRVSFNPFTKNKKIYKTKEGRRDYIGY